MSEMLPSLNTIESRDRERLRNHLVKLVADTDTSLGIMRLEIDHLMEIRHRLFTLPKSFFDTARPTLDQLYDEPTYNDVFVYGYDPRADIKQTDKQGRSLPSGADLASRNGAEFHRGETYSEGDYSRAILKSAASLGFVKDEVLTANDPIGRELGIADSEGGLVGRVDAAVIAGAAGLANPMRIYDTVRDIEQGRIDTDMIILASCDRPVRDDERKRLGDKGMPVGATEFESMILTFNKMTGSVIDPTNTYKFPVRLKAGPDGVFDGLMIQADVTVGGVVRTLIALSAPYDPRRVAGRDKNDDPIYATRANTDETFVAALSFIPEGEGKVLVKSHDTWTIGQGVVGEQIFGIAGKDVIATGPRKLDRVVEKTDEQGATYRSLSQPEGVVDEIAKTYAFLTQVRIKADNAQRALK